MFAETRGNYGRYWSIFWEKLLNFTNQGKVGLEIEREAPDKYIFKVRDSGNGVSLEDQAKIFEPFKQTKKGFDSGGTGLGLAISKELTELMGGVLSVESQLGEGSCFSVSLKLSPAKKAVPTRTKRGRKAIRLLEGSCVKALVVDDIEVNRQLLSTVLQGVGIETLEVGNGKELWSVWMNLNLISYSWTYACRS